MIQRKPGMFVTSVWKEKRKIRAENNNEICKVIVKNKS
jgi:hypothetical protein